MMKVILNNISLSFDCLSSNFQYCKKLQNSIADNSKLQCKINDITSINDTITVENQKLMAEIQLLQLESKNSDVGDKDDSSYTDDGSYTIKDKYQCKKCGKELSSNRRLKEHENKCTGLHPLQCVICLKMFKSAVGKSQHKIYVKCSHPSSSSSNVTNINNNNNINIDNSDNSINNNIQINIRADFDKITNDHFQDIRQTDY